MAVNFNRSHIRLLTDNFKACFCFYRDILELPVRYGKEDEDYAEFKTDAIHLALYRRDLMMEALNRKIPIEKGLIDSSPFIIVLRVDQLDDIYTKLKVKGVAFETEPQDRQEWNCRTAHFHDPDGNLIELNADLPAR
jgi:catechol 2,3-dioxygenase-like lactoylglutathione lyase family enzyme